MVSMPGVEHGPALLVDVLLLLGGLAAAERPVDAGLVALIRSAIDVYVDKVANLDGLVGEGPTVRVGVVARTTHEVLGVVVALFIESLDTDPDQVALADARPDGVDDGRERLLGVGAGNAHEFDLVERS